MKHNKTLTKTYEAISNLSHVWKEAVKQRMGWKSDNPFYNRIGGTIKCTPAEQDVFTQTLAEIEITKPAELFPATEEQLLTAE